MKKILPFYLCFALCSTMAYAQDSCENALEVTAGMFTVDTISSAFPGETCTGGSDALNAEWYKYTAADDYEIIVSTDLSQNAGKDTRIQIYAGSCGNLECIGGDDDAGEVYLSIASFIAYEGETYYISFDDRWDSDGFDFTITEIEYVVPSVTFVQTPTSGVNGSAYGVVDMNGDFLDDIVGVSGTSINIHYQQPDGSFQSVTFNHPQVDNLPSWSLAAGDIDRNGFNDLLYGGGSGVTFMYAADNGLSYTEVSGPEYVFSQRSNFVDINNDGHLDAFVCHDVQPNVYYINDGDNNLEHNQGGLGDSPLGGNYGSIWIDYDNDGDQDLFIAKCRGGNTPIKINELHRNNGDGTFTEVGEEANLADPIQTWSSAWGDYNNDGYMDVFVGASSFADGAHKLMMNNGDGTFTDVTEGSGYENFLPTSIENVTYDFNNDGYLDIRGAGSVIMINNGDMSFTSEAISGTNGPIGDLNNDGFLDVVNGSSIMMNSGNDNNYLKINTIGAESNINGIGARIEVYTENLGQQIRDVRSGDGFRYMSSLNAHFGLGTETEIDSVVINWPSGIVDVYTDVEVNTTFTAVEGEGEIIVDPVNVSDHFLNNLLIYPNPAQNIIIIDAPVDIRSAVFNVFDLSGKKVLSGNLNKNQLNVSSLESGTYIIDIRMDDKNVQRKFVKQ